MSDRDNERMVKRRCVSGDYLLRAGETGLPFVNDGDSGEKILQRFMVAP